MNIRMRIPRQVGKQNRDLYIFYHSYEWDKASRYTFRNRVVLYWYSVDDAIQDKTYPKWCKAITASNDIGRECTRCWQFKERDEYHKFNNGHHWNQQRFKQGMKYYQQQRYAKIREAEKARLEWWKERKRAKCRMYLDPCCWTVVVDDTVCDEVKEVIERIGLT